MRRVLLLGLLALLGCGDDDRAQGAPTAEVTEAPEAAEAPEVAEAPATAEAPPASAATSPADPGDPLAGLDDYERLAAEAPDIAGAPAEDTPVEVPPRGCAPLGVGPQRLWPRAGPANVTAVGSDGFVFAGYAPTAQGAGEEVWAVTLRPGAPARPIFRQDLPHALSVPRTAPPGLGRLDDGHAGLVTIDGSASVRFAVLQTGGQAERWREVGGRADQRFTPAVGAVDGRHVVAFTDGGGDHMRLRLVSFDAMGRELGHHDLTPASMGGAAPTMVDGEPTLLFLDPREATSPVLEVDLSREPPQAEVLVPLTNVYEPAAIAAAAVGETILVGYTAVGMAAATAVGLVAVRDGRAQGPVALVASSGYGMLHVDAAAAGDRRAVFVADRPRGRERDASREVVAVVVEPTEAGIELGEPLVLRGPADAARWGHVARHASGVIAVVFTAASGVYTQLLRCDEG